MATDQEIYDATTDAILKIIQEGQSVGIDGRTRTMADLPELEAIRDKYEARINRSASTGTGGIPVKQIVPGD